MVTFQQYIDKHRKPKRHKSKTPKFQGCPQKKGICLKVMIVKPKKPNSAQRKIAKVTLSNRKKVLAYIQGSGHKLQKHNSVLLRGGRVRDLPGVRYRIMRNKFELKEEIIDRRNRRSKYGVKDPKKKKTP